MTDIIWLTQEYFTVIVCEGEIPFIAIPKCDIEYPFTESELSEHKLSIERLSWGGSKRYIDISKNRYITNIILIKENERHARQAVPLSAQYISSLGEISE